MSVSTSPTEVAHSLPTRRGWCGREHDAVCCAIHGGVHTARSARPVRAHQAAARGVLRGGQVQRGTRLMTLLTKVGQYE
eukprot:2789486-Pyramimonas_sp.AAC.1